MMPSVTDRPANRAMLTGSQVVPTTPMPCKSLTVFCTGRYERDESLAARKYNLERQGRPVLRTTDSALLRSRVLLLETSVTLDKHPYSQLMLFDGRI